MNILARTPRRFKRLIPYSVRQFLGHYIGRRESLADITVVEDLLEVLRETSQTQVWLDVGAYRGDMTLPLARRFSQLMVYAFEPNLALATRLSRCRRNYVVVPAAVAERDGIAPFFVTRFPAASSLLPLNPGGVRERGGREKLEVVEQRTVPTIRLETFLNALEISHVDFLKVDAQGADLAVVASAGSRLKDISRVVFEVAIAPEKIYSGAANKAAAIEFMSRSGFALAYTKAQYEGQEENLTFVRANDRPSRDTRRPAPLRTLSPSLHQTAGKEK